MKFWKKCLICILILEILGNASGLITLSSIKDWYTALEKPIGTPPNGSFGPVWVILYAMMGVSLAFLWAKETSTEGQKVQKKTAIKWFFIQYLVNLSWTPVFFGLKRPDIASFLIISLIIFILLCISSLRYVSKISSFLLYPYLLWVIYAAYLNISIFLLNK